MQGRHGWAAPNMCDHKEVKKIVITIMSYVFASLPPRMSGTPCQPMPSSHQKKKKKKVR